MRATFNLGIGMIVVTPDGGAAVDALHALGISAWIAGEVGPGSGAALR